MQNIYVKSEFIHFVKKKLIKFCKLFYTLNNQQIIKISFFQLNSLLVLI